MYYSSELFADLADIIFTDEIPMARIMAGRSPAARWTTDNGIEYVLEQAYRPAERIDETGSTETTYTQTYTLQESIINRRAPHNSLVSEHTASIQDGASLPIKSIGHFEQYPDQLSAQARLAHRAIAVLIDRAATISPQETAKISKDHYDAMFLQTVGVYMLSHLAVEGTADQDAEDISEDVADEAVDDHVKRMRTIRSEEYWSNRRGELEECFCTATDVRIAADTTPHDGSHDSTYPKELRENIGLINIVASVAESLGGKWTTTVSEDTDKFDIDEQSSNSGE